MLKSSLDNSPTISQGLHTEVLDFTLEQNSLEIAERVLMSNPDYVGFSVYLWNRDILEKAALIIREQRPGIVLLAGGAEATANPQGLLEKGAFDFIIKGEAETIIVKIMERLLKSEDVQSLEGLVLLGQQEIGPSAFVSNLDELPSPFLMDALSLHGQSGVLWELSRGCPFRCDFCFESRGTSGVRRFSLERIEKELEIIEQSGVSQIFVLDPTFNQDKARAKAILRMMKKSARGIHFTFEVRTEFLDPEMAQLFSALNCSLQIGLQSADPLVLKNVNRSLNPQSFKAKIDLLNSHGVTFGLDLIYGLPGDTLEGFRRSLDYALERQPNHLDIFQLSLLPGTKLFENRMDFNLTYECEAPYRVVETPTFTTEELRKARALAEACDILYNKGGAVGWFFVLLEALRLRPSEVLGRFVNWSGSKGIKENLSPARILDLQLRFVQGLFEKTDKLNLFVPMRNLIEYHGAMTRSLFAPATVNDPLTAQDLERIKIKCALGTCIINIDFDLDDLLVIGTVPLSGFLKTHHLKKNSVAVYNYRGEVNAVMIDKPWAAVLKCFDGSHTAAEVRKTLPPRTQKDFSEFLDYAWSEGIIERA